MIAGHCYAVFKKEPLGNIGAFAGSNLCYLIMAPIIGVRIKKEMEINRENVTLLTEFLVLNECADAFTNVDTETVERELDAAHDSSKVILLWFRITMVMFCLTCLTTSLYFCAPAVFKKFFD